jgi:hypothetical protein
VLVRPNPPLPQLDPAFPRIHAEISGSDRCTALGLEVRASAPVLGLCRLLVETGYDPGLRLDAYRGETLCLRVRSIGEVAGLEINGKGTGLRPRHAVATASPIEYFGQPLPDTRPPAGAHPASPRVPTDLSIPDFLKRTPDGVTS